VKRSFVLALLALGLLLGVSGLATASNANGNHDSYSWSVGFTTGTATAVAPDGSTITMSGDGTLMAGPGKTATGSGSYSLSTGGSGTYTVTGIDSFVSYGAGTAFPGAFGGEAKLKIALSNGDSGVLTIYCLQGSPPPSKMEGISVILGSGGQFTKPDGGNTVFIHS
jgi:hypothetical protein